MAKKTEMGVCPKCESVDVEYIDLDYEGEYIVHNCECMNCHFTFREYEKTIYDGYSYDGEDGKYHDFDENGDELGR